MTEGGSGPTKMPGPRLGGDPFRPLHLLAVISFTVLAFFITVMAGESGNTATQSLAVVVRGIATGEINGRKIWRVVWLEAQAGVLVGLVTGLVLAGRLLRPGNVHPQGLRLA